MFNLNAYFIYHFHSHTLSLRALVTEINKKNDQIVLLANASY